MYICIHIYICVHAADTTAASTGPPTPPPPVVLVHTHNAWNTQHIHNTYTTHTRNGRRPLRVIEHTYMHSCGPGSALVTLTALGPRAYPLERSMLWRSATAASAAIFCLGWSLEASRGPDEHKSVFLGCLHSDIVLYPSLARWTLPTCFNMPYTAFNPTTACLV